MMQNTASTLATRSETTPSAVGNGSFRVLARLPHLAVAKMEVWNEPAEVKWGRRLLSQSLSVKLLACAGVVLVLGAIVPFLLGNRAAKRNSSILPPSDQFQSVPKTDTSKTVSGFTPSTTTAAAHPLAIANQARDTVKLPADEKAVSPTVNELLGQGSPAASPWPGPPKTDTTVTRVLPSPSASYDRPTPGASANPESYSTGTPNRAMSLGRGPAETRGGYPAESLADRQMSPPPAATPAGVFEPGVARFEGTIEKPSVRTTYDRPRPSVY